MKSLIAFIVGLVVAIAAFVALGFVEFDSTPVELLTFLVVPGFVIFAIADQLGANPHGTWLIFAYLFTPLLNGLIYAVLWKVIRSFGKPGLAARQE